MFRTLTVRSSVIHTLQKKRSDLKILMGPKDQPNMHRLNGDVVTPLFHHLGASSWHSYDAALIVSLGRIDRNTWLGGVGLAAFVSAVGVAIWIGMLRLRLKRRRASLGARSRSPDPVSFGGLDETLKRA